MPHLFPEGEATLFKDPVEWPNPVVTRHDGTDYPWGMNLRMSVFAAQHADDMRRKYTRGSCHAHAAASVEVHGGRILGLMWKGKVVHVLSLHVDDGLSFTKDVTGDEAWPKDWSFAPEDFRGLSEAHLLGCPIDSVIVSELFPWDLPCTAPTAEEIADARVLSTVLTIPGMRCPEPDDDFTPDF